MCWNITKNNIYKRYKRPVHSHWCFSDAVRHEIQNFGKPQTAEKGWDGGRANKVEWGNNSDLLGSSGRQHTDDMNEKNREKKRIIDQVYIK